MAGPSKRTTVVLTVLAIIFIIVLTIICLVPSRGPADQYVAGKSAGAVPEGILTETPETTVATSTSTTAKPTNAVTEASSTEATLPTDEDANETTLSDIDYSDDNDTVLEEPKDEVEEPVETTTTEPWYNSTSTSTEMITQGHDNGSREYETTEASTSANFTTELATTVAITHPTHHYDEVHNETATEITYLYNETAIYNSPKHNESSSSTELPPEDSIHQAVNVTEAETSTDVEAAADYGLTSPTETTTPSTSFSITSASISNDTTLADTSSTSEVTSATTESTTTEPTTTEPTTTEPTTAEPTTTESTTTEPTTTEPTTTEPTTTEPTTTDMLQEVHISESKGTGNVCTHSDCKEFAARMLDMMNHRADPCQDFYNYACGGVEDDPFLHPEDPAQQVSTKMLEMLSLPDDPDLPSLEPAKKFYQTCIESPHVPSPEVVGKLRDLVGKYGLLDPSVLPGEQPSPENDLSAEGVFSLERMLADFIKLDFALLFDVGVEVDKTESDKFTVRLSLPLNGLDSGLSQSIDTAVCVEESQRTMDEELRNTKKVDVNFQYDELKNCTMEGFGRASLVNRLKEAATALNLTGRVTDPAQASRLIGETALDSEFLLKDIMEMWPDPSEIRYYILNKNFTEHTVEQLDSSDILTNLVNWSSLLQSVVGKQVKTVQVYHEAELRSVMKEVASHDVTNMRNILRMLWGARLYTDTLAPEGKGAPNSPSYCVAALQYLMPDIAAELFLKSFSVLELEAMGKQVNRVLNSVKKTMSAALKDKPGVSDELKDKLVRTYSQVGTTQYLQELSEDVAKSMESLFLEDDYVGNVLILLKRRRAMMYSVLDGSTTDHTALWNHFSVPYSITATTVYIANIILIPEGIMTAPFLYPHLTHLPEYLVFAGIGHVIAHELLHAMDTTGIKFDGLVGEELTRPRGMDARENCFSQVLTLNNFSLPVGNSYQVIFRPESELRLNELMVDSEATRLAWLAYVHGDTLDAGAQLEVVTDRPMRRRRSDRHHDTTESLEQVLPWLGLSTHELFPLRTAQSGFQENGVMVDSGATRVSWRRTYVHGDTLDAGAPLPVVTDRPTRRSGSDRHHVTTESSEQVLPWLGLSPYQLYLLRTAQTQCAATSHQDIMALMEKEHLPARMRVNLALMNEPLFAEAFGCSSESNMGSSYTCPYIVGHMPIH